jgi:hypothetical protein
MSFLKEPFKPINQRWQYVSLLWFVRTTLIDRHGGHGPFLSVSLPSLSTAYTDLSAGVVGCFSTYATVFPSKAFGVLNIMFTIFMVIMYASFSVHDRGS